jgi:bifunctional UDP-N-acetylglucosamine pyrophosphorylase/glucosamine-1-phosphate N-acetyltransferase
VTMVDPASVWISAESTIGEDTVLHPNVYLRGKTTIGAGCRIGAFSLLENATVPEGTILAPYTHLSD